MDWKLEVVVVPVSNVDEAKQFYHAKLGFAVDHDTQLGETYRIIQLTPPGSGCSIVIGNQNRGMLPGSLKGLQLVVSDIAQARSQLLENGVRVSAIQHYEGTVLVDGPGGRWNSFVFFSDPDGNEWAIQERPAES
jgi:catechol 2,3-dioxygenase-like lactoylglutathione lyase family enzyme